MGHVLYAAVMLPEFYKIISLEKKKNLYEIEVSNTASLHRIFYLLEVTISVEWPTHLPIVGGGGVSLVV